jgi:hypothetical protein
MRGFDAAFGVASSDLHPTRPMRHALRPRWRARRAVRLLLASPLAIGAAVGCATTGGSLDRLHREPPVAYRGHYTVGAEGSWFVPCGGAAADAWWVTVVDSAVGQLDRARAAGQVVAERPSYVEWLGVRTEGGEVGPPGRTALLVRALVVARPAAPGDCGG